MGDGDEKGCGESIRLRPICSSPQPKGGELTGPEYS